MDSIKNSIASITDAATSLISSIFKKDSEENPDDVITKEEDPAITDLIIEYDGDSLTVDSISRICDAILRLASPEFIKLFQKDRTERRAHKNDLPTYIELYDSYARQMGNILEELQKKILQALSVSESAWENSVSQGNDEIMVLLDSFPQKLKLNLVSTKTLTKEELITVLKAQVRLLSEAGDNIDEISPYIRNPEEIVPITLNRVNDAIYEEHGVEEEDIFLGVTQYIAEHEVQQIVFDVQRASMRLMELQQSGM